mmetsp:Transcript_16346/g.24268  ORF Transcript_16346/g.24268 Transcript_16346/m.24268 type:complete len:268 (-) Transcript_16346:1227-2030(-)|eukprot:scaffold6019_cov78-Skeletonema_dohrnii-CCMP3373.AAC.1
MLPVTITILLLNAFSFVHACPPYCGLGGPNSVRLDTSVVESFNFQCICFAYECDSQVGATISEAADDLDDCIEICCNKCNDRRGRLLREESENTPSVEESNSTRPDPDPLCHCYGVKNLIKPCPLFPPANFGECSEQCNSNCYAPDPAPPGSEIDGCEVSPIFVHEFKTIDETTAKNYISDWQASGESGRVCVCKNKGFMVGRNNSTDFQEENCDEFCLRVDSLGGVKYWLTTDEEQTTWAVAFLSSVVCVGFIMIAALFCVGSGSK